MVKAKNWSGSSLNLWRTLLKAREEGQPCDHVLVDCGYEFDVDPYLLTLADGHKNKIAMCSTAGFDYTIEMLYRQR